jgi:hypothetical protein
LDYWDFNSVPLKQRPDSLLNWNSLFLSMTDAQSSITVEVPSVQLLNFDEKICMVFVIGFFFYCKEEGVLCLSLKLTLVKVVFDDLLNEISH